MRKNLGLQRNESTFQTQGNQQVDRLEGRNGEATWKVVCLECQLLAETFNVFEVNEGLF